MNDGKEKSRAVKKSISMPQELWDFVTEMKGEFGESSRVIQKALRELQERSQKAAEQKKESGLRKINEAIGKKQDT